MKKLFVVFFISFFLGMAFSIPSGVEGLWLAKAFGEINPRVGSVNFPSVVYTNRDTTVNSSYSAATSVSDLKELRILIASHLAVEPNEFQPMVRRDTDGVLRAYLHAEQVGYNFYGDGSILNGTGVRIGVGAPLHDGKVISNQWSQWNVGESYVEVSADQKAITVHWSFQLKYGTGTQTLYSYVIDVNGGVETVSDGHVANGWHNRGAVNVGQQTEPVHAASKVSSFDLDQRSGLLGVSSLEAEHFHWMLHTPQLNAMDDIGVRAIRFTFHWDKLQPNNQHDYDDILLTHYDEAIQALKNRGIEIIGLINGTPGWARNDLNDQHKCSQCGSKNEIPYGRRLPDMYTSGAIWGYENFIRKIADRYKDKVQYYEYWNEPNGYGFYPNDRQDCQWCQRKTDSEIGEYLDWLLITRNALLFGNPRAKLAIGGLDGTANWPGYTKTDFLGRIYSIIKQRQVYNNPDQYFDALALHPYDWDGVIDTDLILLNRSLMQVQGDGDKPIWITEYGWKLWQVSEEKQAENLINALNTLASSNFSFVQFAIHQSLFDSFTQPHGDPNDPRNPCPDLGPCSLECPPGEMQGLMTYFYYVPPCGKNQYHYCPFQTVCDSAYRRKAYYAYRNFTKGDNITFSSPDLRAGTSVTATVRHPLMPPAGNIYQLSFHGRADDGTEISETYGLQPIPQCESGWYCWQTTFTPPRKGNFKIDLITNPGSLLYSRKSIQIMSTYPRVGDVTIPQEAYLNGETTFVSRYSMPPDALDGDTRNLREMRLLVSTNLQVEPNQFHGRVVQEGTDFKAYLHTEQPGPNWNGGVSIGKDQPITTIPPLENSWAVFNVGKSYVVVDSASRTITVHWNVQFKYIVGGLQKVFSYVQSSTGDEDRTPPSHVANGYHDKGYFEIIGVSNFSFELDPLGERGRPTYWYLSPDSFSFQGPPTRFWIVDQPVSDGTKSLKVEAAPKAWDTYQGIRQDTKSPGAGKSMVFSCDMKVERGKAFVGVYSFNPFPNGIWLGYVEVDPGVDKSAGWQKVSLPFRIPEGVQRVYYVIDAIQLANVSERTLFYVDNVNLAEVSSTTADTGISSLPSTDAERK